MSLRPASPDLDVEHTDYSPYHHRALHYIKVRRAREAAAKKRRERDAREEAAKKRRERDAREEAAKERQRDDRRVQPAPTPPSTKPLTNPWTTESATQLWLQLTEISPAVGVGDKFELPQLIRALDAGSVELRTQFGLPEPARRVQSTAVGNQNRDYVTKLFNLVSNQGAQPFNRVSLIAYLTTPDKDPLPRVLLTTAARAPGVHALPALHLRV
jgi:hypothetical protein